MRQRALSFCGPRQRGRLVETQHAGASNRGLLKQPFSRIRVPQVSHGELVFELPYWEEQCWR